MRAIGIDMKTATLFLVGHHNEIPRGASLVVFEVPMIPEGIKTEEMDREVDTKFSELHREIGIATMDALQKSGEQVKHLRY
jgi:AMP nucleosidase